MNRLIKWIAIVFAGLVLLMVLAAVLLPKFIDPNNYRDDISQIAYEQTGLTLKINGPIGWSVFPWLGLTLEDLSIAGQDGSKLASLDSADVSVKLLPLLAKNIEVKNASLDGVNLELTKGKNGKGNWDVAKPSTSTLAEGQASTPAEPASTTNSAPLKLDIAKVSVSNLNIRYDDKLSGDSYVVNNASLETGAIKNQMPFDIAIKALVLSEKPKLSLDTDLKGTVTFNLEKGIYDLNDLSITAKPDVAKGEPLNLTGNIHLEQQPLLVKGHLDVTRFNPKSLMTQLNIAIPPMADKNALESLAFKSSFQTNGKSLKADTLDLTLDDFSLNGFVNVTDLTKQAITFKFTGNDLNLDNYLPPATTPAASTQTKETTSSAPTPAGKELPLIPEELLRGLNINGSMSLSSLTASKLRFDKPSIALSAANGRSDVKLTSDFYQGTIRFDGKADVRVQGMPKLAATAGLKGINIEALAVPVPELKAVQGNVNAEMTVTTQGQLQRVLTKNLNGTVSFDVNKGAFTEANFNKMVCEGIALVRQKKLQKKDWGSASQFENLSGTFTIRNGVATNKDLSAALSSMNLKGDGNINLVEQTLDYHVGLNIRGDEKSIDNDPACAINKDYVNVTWPVRCVGKLGEQQCGIDTERMAGTIASLAKGEAKKHIKDAIDKNVEGSLKDTLKGFFN